MSRASKPTFGDYQVVESLAGPWREAYIAERAGEDMVILVLYTVPPAQRAQVDAEIERATTLKHRAALRIVDVFDVGPKLALAFEWVDGISLERMLLHLQDHSEKLACPAAAFIGMELATALSEGQRVAPKSANKGTLVHGLLSPRHVLVDFNGSVKLVGLGLRELARVAREPKQQDDYRPSQVDEPSPEGDVYRLAATIWAALVNQPPPAKRATMPSLAKLRPELDGQVRFALERVVRQEGRPMSVHALSSLLKRATKDADQEELAWNMDLMRSALGGGLTDLVAALPANLVDAAPLHDGALHDDDDDDLDEVSSDAKPTREWVVSAALAEVIEKQRIALSNRAPASVEPPSSEAPSEVASEAASQPVPSSAPISDDTAEPTSEWQRGDFASLPGALPDPAPPEDGTELLAPPPPTEVDEEQRIPTLQPPRETPFQKRLTPRVVPAVGPMGVQTPRVEVLRSADPSGPIVVRAHAGAAPIVGTPPAPAAPRPPIGWLAAVAGCSLVAFVLGVVVTAMGVVRVPVLEATPSTPSTASPPAASTTEGELPSPSAALDASAEPAIDPSAEPAIEASAAPSADPSAPASAQPDASAKAELDPKSLPPGQGILLVRSTIDAGVYSGRTLLGKTGEKLIVRCGTRFLRLGSVPLNRWFAPGKAVAIKCRGLTSIGLLPEWRKGR